MTTIAAPMPCTPEEIERLSKQDGKLYELVRGILVEKPMSTRSNTVAADIIVALRAVYPRSEAYLFVEQPTYCFDDPGEMRRPDVALVWVRRLPQGVNDRELEIAPDLVVEVVSPTNTFFNIDERIAEYFGAGVPLIWVVNPKLRHVYAHRPVGPITQYRKSDTIRDEPLLPGLVLNVSDFLAASSGSEPGEPSPRIGRET